MTRYDNGADLERAAKKSLEEDGYYVIKSGGSKGIVDLAAFKPGETLFVQCKRDGYMSPDDRVKFLILARDLGTVPLIGWWAKEGRAARQLAFRELTGIGPGTFRLWTADHAITEVTG